MNISVSYRAIGRSKEKQDNTDESSEF